MSETTSGKVRAAGVAMGPVFLMAAMLYHPYIANLMDASSVATAMSADLTRWAFAHIAVGLGSALLLLAFLGVRSHLREAGENTWSGFAVPFLVMGTVLFVFLPAFEVAMASASEAGADPVRLQEELSTWFTPILMSAALTFGIGVVSLAVATTRSGVFSREVGRIIAFALVVVALTRFIPAGSALYAGAVAGVIALVPIAIQIWSGAAVAQLRPRTMLAAGRGGAR